ncbi:GtrA family protein [Faecalibacillus intestinalis]|uniref:GtrA family protein n=1 Tax=Faecalibacillus intestinalis TaxID=1982626 RepID=UPI0022E8A538|nr:GtrA family protein [Faecalibacillus intestinalis]
MKNIIQKNKEIIMYLVFGVLTTVVNIVVYYIFSNLLHMNYLFSNAMAWFLSVLFAYVTNRKYVFDSKNNQIIKEAISFFGSRLATGIMDMMLMWFLVNFNIVNDVVAKVVDNVIVVILNYILSKLVVFKK